MTSSWSVQAGLLEEGLILAEECLELGIILSCEDKNKKILKLYGHLGHIQMQVSGFSNKTPLRYLNYILVLMLYQLY